MVVPPRLKPAFLWRLWRLGLASDPLPTLSFAEPPADWHSAMPRPTRRAKLILLLFVASAIFSACTANIRTPIRTDSIPRAPILSADDEAYGAALVQNLRSDQEPDTEIEHHLRVERIFESLAGAAKINRQAWRIHLLLDPDTADVRALHGKQLVVWSGIFDLVRSDEELAGLFACELAHTLARHTDPVAFHPAAELLFGLTDIAATMGLAILSQGIVAVNLPGMTRWAYLEATDLDPVDRVYSEEEEQETASIAALLLAASGYRPGALAEFWQRVSTDNGLQQNAEPLLRNLPPHARSKLIARAIAEMPDAGLANSENPASAQTAVSAVSGPAPGIQATLADDSLNK